MIPQPKSRAQDETHRRSECCFRAQLKHCTVAAALTVIGVSVAPSAAADSAASLRAAVEAARPASCSPLRADPVIDQAANEINKTTDRWINNAARAVPETNAMSVLKDLGYGGNKAAIWSGAAPSESDAIKATLIQGFKQLPDCSYTDIGVSTLYNEKKGLILTTVVLAA